MGFAANLARIARSLTASTSGDLTAANTPAQSDSSSLLATTGYVKAGGRLSRTLVYRRSAGVQQVSIDGAAYTATGASTYTPATGMQFIIARVLGGGGAGGGAGGAAAGNASLGAPGSSGAFGVSRFTAAEVGASQAITVGLGGAQASNAAGGAGGASSVGALISAPGGSGGGTLTNQVPPAVNGNGTGSSAPTGANLLSVSGQAGPASFASSSNANGMLGGSGGTSHLGPGPSGPAGNSAGASASNYGTGGSGCVLNQAGGSTSGGNGAAGVVIIEEYV